MRSLDSYVPTLAQLSSPRRWILPGKSNKLNSSWQPELLYGCVFRSGAALYRRPLSSQLVGFRARPKRPRNLCPSRLHALRPISFFTPGHVFLINNNNDRYTHTFAALIVFFEHF